MVQLSCGWVFSKTRLQTNWPWTSKRDSSRSVTIDWQMHSVEKFPPPPPLPTAANFSHRDASQKKKERNYFRSFQEPSLVLNWSPLSEQMVNSTEADGRVLLRHYSLLILFFFSTTAIKRGQREGQRPNHLVSFKLGKVT